jgi:hypothetical protein
MTTAVIDVSRSCQDKAAILRASGVQTVARYYSRDTIAPSKRLTVAEARELARGGLRLCIVYEGRFGDKVDNFDKIAGIADGRYARSYAHGSIGQPTGSAIYFAVDFDASVSQIKDRVIPYFQSIADAFNAATQESSYEVGVYGSGATCRAVLDAGLARFAWLAQSTGWSGYKSFLNSNRWSLRQGMPITIGDLRCDPNERAPSGGIGDFAMPAIPASTSQDNQQNLLVNARQGLRLRTGPGTSFDYSRTLALGAVVHPLKIVDGWTMVDLEGDGVADGFVSSAYLISAAADDLRYASSASIADAAHTSELIRQGSTPEGLKRARETAKAALTGYPTDGCAAHLSALLEQAGIDVEMTFGAGKLAHILSERGWTRVAITRQRAGDVGVCFDNISPPGSDHVYLVVSTSGPDQMMVADNQCKTDAPHIRYASGHGQTATEYFLRAI